MKHFAIPDDSCCCINCHNFRQHYIEDHPGSHLAVPVFFGHCMYPRVKIRRPSDTCEKFKERENEP